MPAALITPRRRDLVPAAERKLAGSGWLPPALHTPKDCTAEPMGEKVEEHGEKVA